jgi:hypothetical protein
LAEVATVQELQPPNLLLLRAAAVLAVTAAIAAAAAVAKTSCFPPARLTVLGHPPLLLCAAAAVAAAICSEKSLENEWIAAVVVAALHENLVSEQKNKQTGEKGQVCRLLQLLIVFTQPQELVHL